MRCNKFYKEKMDRKGRGSMVWVGAECSKVKGEVLIPGRRVVQVKGRACAKALWQRNA